MILAKKQRQRTIREILSLEKIDGQLALRNELKRRGVVTNQATISRDLKELKVTKIGGYYSFSDLEASTSTKTLGIIKFDFAGDCLLVLRTLPGQASSLAYLIDCAEIHEIVGTLAGDDTVFIATKGKKEQKIALEEVLVLVR